jgi:hypothetical protein
VSEALAADFAELEAFISTSTNPHAPNEVERSGVWTLALEKFTSLVNTGTPALGFGSDYCAGIRKKATHGRDDAHAQHLYRTALERTLKAKARREDRDDVPY